MYGVRVYCVFSTHWRRDETQEWHSSGQAPLLSRFQSFYGESQSQLPELLVEREIEPGRATFGTRALPGQEDRPPEIIDGAKAELLLMSLPFPANQLVAVLILEFDVPDLNDDSDLLQRVLEACTSPGLEVNLSGRDLSALMDWLIEDAPKVAETPADPDELPSDIPRERHALVFITNLNGTTPPRDQTVAGILYGIQPPYRPEFTSLQQPSSLNREKGTFAAVSQSSSFFFGHPSVVEHSALLTTVQAVGTAARFQRIWRDAYFQVQQFQKPGRQARKAGEQGRKALETLADEMGNLELDLAFSVETAADLGLGSTTSRIDDFHDSLYQVMNIKTRAHTVSQMFVRLASSIRSELTAIESREKEVEDDRRFRGALTLGVLSFLLAPTALILGFFGVNATQVDQSDTMFDLRRYWFIYLFALLLMAVPLAFAITFDKDALSRRIDSLLAHLKSRKGKGKPDDPS